MLPLCEEELSSNGRKKSRVNDDCQDCSSGECWKSIIISNAGEKEIWGGVMHSVFWDHSFGSLIFESVTQ